MASANPFTPPMRPPPNVTLKDGTTGPATYLSDYSPSVLATHSSRSAANSAAYLLPHLESLSSSKPSFTLLDVGCGPGTITIDLASRFPSATIIGTELADAEKDALGTARQLAEQQQLSNVTFETADVHALADKFGTAKFDVVHSHQLLQHCGDAVHALQQMKAVTAAGGLVASRVADMSTIACYPPDHPGIRTWQQLFLEMTGKSGGEPAAGRLLHVWARQAGFEMDRAVKGAGVQLWSSRQEREGFAKQMAERMVSGKWAEQAVGKGFVKGMDELHALATSLEEWGKDVDGWVCIVNGEFVGKV